MFKRLIAYNSLRFILILMGMTLLVSPAWAKSAKEEKSKVNASSSQTKKLTPEDKKFRSLKFKIDKGYQQARRLAKKKSYKAFSKKVESLKALLADPAVPERYRKTMLRKLMELSDQMEVEYQYKQDVRGQKQEAAMMKISAPTSPKPKLGTYSNDADEDQKLREFKEQYDADGHRLREQVFKEQPKYRGGPKDLAPAVVERKVKILRQREFLMSEFEKGVDAQYRTAVQLFDSKQYTRSMTAFLGIEKMSPDYKETRNYLKKLKGLVKKERGSNAKVTAKPQKSKPVKSSKPVSSKKKAEPEPMVKTSRTSAVNAALDDFEKTYPQEETP